MSDLNAAPEAPVLTDVVTPVTEAPVLTDVVTPVTEPAPVAQAEPVAEAPNAVAQEPASESASALMDLEDILDGFLNHSLMTGMQRLQDAISARRN